MIEIVPAINVRTFAEVVDRIRTAEQHAHWVHIDVADGSWTPQSVWHEAKNLIGFSSPASIEIHLMTTDPIAKLPDWLKTPMARLIFHIEAAEDPRRMIHMLRDAGIEAGLAITPPTAPDVLLPYTDDVQLLQLLAVSPGPSGQGFDQKTLEKIAFLRERAPHLPIEVDGGIKEGTARACAHAGASFLVAGSALYASPLPFAQAFERLRGDAA